MVFGLSQDEFTTNNKRKPVTSKARHVIIRTSINVLATTVSVDNGRRQIGVNLLSRFSKLSHLFGCSVVEYTTGHWSAR